MQIPYTAITTISIPSVIIVISPSSSLLSSQLCRISKVFYHCLIENGRSFLSRANSNSRDLGILIASQFLQFDCLTSNHKTNFFDT
ncbi:unnamed protein product [Schistosoma margrebowiei]|uniref:Uncharacterized protein n=1 Tax=Schistosoma margrebowiei TaxID=48269 RepID=A0AA84ZTU4_9TREM|nr:unnamed protein product [Schistosoma margrebowiei]